MGIASGNRKTIWNALKAPKVVVMNEDNLLKPRASSREYRIPRANTLARRITGSFRALNVQSPARNEKKSRASKLLLLAIVLFAANLIFMSFMYPNVYITAKELIIEYTYRARHTAQSVDLKSVRSTLETATLQASGLER